MIPYGKQDISEEDIASVVEVLRSDFLTQGPKVPEFERAISEYCGVRYATAVNSATSALHIACLALGVKEGDVVWTTPITFVASANCALYCGASVDFVDIDPATWNLCPIKLREKLEFVERTGGVLPKVVIPVHLTGQSCEMAEIKRLSQHYGFRIIEDASHAIGAKYESKPVGNCEYSDITIFSFHPVKIITTAEGGVAVTNCSELHQKMELLRSHGITRDPQKMSGESDGPWYYQQVGLGFNYRMTELQAALGVSQLKRLDSFVQIRNELAKRYDELLNNLPIKLPSVISNSYSAWHLYVIRLIGASKSRHLQVFNALREKGIGVNLHYIPVHTQPWYSQMGFQLGMFPEAEAYYQEAISLPMFHLLTHEQQDYIANVLAELL